MKTIRDAIKASLDKQDKNIISIQFNSIQFPNVLRAFAKILYIDTALRCGLQIDMKIISVLSETIFNLDSVSQWLQMCGFLEWWLNCEAEIDLDNDILWYSSCEIEKKWNEYAQKEISKRGSDQ